MKKLGLQLISIDKQDSFSYLPPWFLNAIPFEAHDVSFIFLYLPTLKPYQPLQWLVLALTDLHLPQVQLQYLHQ